MSYAGQHGERLRPVNDMERTFPDLMFTEKDRRAAQRAIDEKIMSLGALTRLRDQARDMKSVQAEYFLAAFQEVCGVEKTYDLLDQGFIDITTDS